LLDVNTLQNADFSQNLYAGQLPSDKIAHRRNDKPIPFNKGKVIVL